MQTKLQVAAPHPVRMVAFKKLGKKCWQGCNKEEGTLIIRLVGVQMTRASKGVSLKNNHHMTQLYYFYVDSELSDQDTCTLRLITAVFTKARKQNQPSAQSQMNNENCGIHPWWNFIPL